MSEESERSHAEPASEGGEPGVLFSADSSESSPKSGGSTETERSGSSPPRASAAPLVPLVPMRAMRVISVGDDSISAPYSAGPEPAFGGDLGLEVEPGPEIETQESALSDEELGDEEFEDVEETTPSLEEADLEDAHSDLPPPVSEVPPLPPTRREPVAVAPPPSLRAQETAEPPSSEKKVPAPPARSLKPALPSAKPKRKPWWEEAFGDDFSRAHQPLSDQQVSSEVDFITSSLGLSAGAVILDLCCGQGQLAIELSRRGHPVVGYDLSVFQLAVAADFAQTARQKINFLQGDMREMAFDAMFDAVVCWDTSFGYFEEEKNVDVIRRIFSALKPGGSLLLDIMNRDSAAREAPSNHWFEGDGCICMDDMSLDWITSRLKVKRSVILDDGRSKELLYSIRLYNLSEIGKILHDVGFRVLSVSGHPSTPGAFLGSRSPRIIIHAQRPGS